MATPIIESIANELLTRIQGITVDNGYEFTAGTVKYVNRDINEHNPSARDITLDLQDIELNEERSYPGNPPRTAWDATFEITGYAKQLDRDTTETGITDNAVTDYQMMSAILRAITNNGSTTWHTFASNAENAWFTNQSPMDAAGHDGAKVSLTIQYRTSELNPYSLS